MKNLSLSFFYITLLVGCSSNNVVKQDKLNATSDYFSDSSECSKVTLRNNQTINLPMGKNPNVYLSCMKQKGWTEPTADTSDYRAASTVCQEEAKGKANVDASYADCIKRSQKKNDDK